LQLTNQKSATEETMVDRRTFTTILVGSIVAPRTSFAQSSKAKSVFYSGVGPEHQRLRAFLGCQRRPADENRAA
jgi:hypothetical protein